MNQECGTAVGRESLTTITENLELNIAKPLKGEQCRRADHPERYCAWPHIVHRSERLYTICHACREAQVLSLESQWKWNLEMQSKEEVFCVRRRNIFPDVDNQMWMSHSAEHSAAGSVDTHIRQPITESKHTFSF